MGTKKILGCLAKFWVNGHCLSEKCRNFGVFMSFWPCQEWKTFSKCHKSQYFCICTYKYQIFWLFKWFLHFLNWQTYKNSRKMEDFEQNKVHLLKILLNNLIFFLFPKFLELFFTPKNTPPKVKNSKPFRITIFFGTPCRYNLECFQ